jgi:hypothetical protein
MRKTAATLITAILITAVAGGFLVHSAVADAYETYRPETTPTAIIVSTPLNNSITNENSISLAFNVTAPIVVSAPEEAQSVSTRLASVYYKGDWQDEKQELYAYDYLHAPNVEKFDFLEFNTTLSNIPEGTHELQITASGTVGLTVAMFGFSYHSGSNSSIIFTVDSIQPTQPNQEPFPTLPVLAASVAVVVVGAGLLVYFKKRKR